MDALISVLNSDVPFEQQLLELMNVRSKADPHFVNRHEVYSQEAAEADKIVRSVLNAIRKEAYTQDIHLDERKLQIFEDPSFFDEEAEDQDVNRETAFVQYEMDVADIDTTTPVGQKHMELMNKAEQYVCTLAAKTVEPDIKSLIRNAAKFELIMTTLEQYKLDSKSSQQPQTNTDANTAANLHDLSLDVLQAYEYRHSPGVNKVDEELIPADITPSEKSFLTDSDLLGKVQPCVTKEVNKLKNDFREVHELDEQIKALKQSMIPNDMYVRRYHELPSQIKESLYAVNIIELARDFAVMSYGNSEDIRRRAEARKAYPTVREEFAAELANLENQPPVEPLPEIKSSGPVTAEQLSTELETAKSSRAVVNRQRLVS